MRSAIAARIVASHWLVSYRSIQAIERSVAMTAKFGGWDAKTSRSPVADCAALGYLKAELSRSIELYSAKSSVAVTTFIARL